MNGEIVMDSHEYASKLKEIADFLLANPSFNTESYSAYVLFHFNSKTNAVAAMKSVNPDKRGKVTDPNRSYVDFTKTLGASVSIEMCVQKNIVYAEPPPLVEVKIAPEFEIGKSEETAA